MWILSKFLRFSQQQQNPNIKFLQIIHRKRQNKIWCQFSLLGQEPTCKIAKFLLIHSFKWHKPFPGCKVCLYPIYALSQAKLRKVARKDVNVVPVISPRQTKMKRNFTFFFGKYKNYFISCVENIRNFIRATQSWNYWCFQHIRL